VLETLKKKAIISFNTSLSPSAYVSVCLSICFSACPHVTTGIRDDEFS